MIILNLKKYSAVLLYLALIGSLAIAHATITIYSNIVAVTPQTYSLSLNVNNTTPAMYTFINLSGILTFGSAFMPDATILLFEQSNGSWDQIDTALTTTDGEYYFLYNITTNATRNFRTEFNYD